MPDHTTIATGTGERPISRRTLFRYGAAAAGALGAGSLLAACGGVNSTRPPRARHRPARRHILHIDPN